MSSSSSLEFCFDDDDDDYFEENVSIKRLQNMTMLMAPIIPLPIDDEQSNMEECFHGGSVPSRRFYGRQRELAHDRIWKDYFTESPKYPLYYFRRRFRMQRHLYLYSLHDIERYDIYFTQREDATGRMGLSSLHKMTATMRMISTGCSADNLDEYIQIGESTTIESLKHFCDAIIGLYENQYMRRPNETDVARLLAEGEDRGFPGMMGSLDCMHWIWKNFPTSWHGTHTHTQGPRKAPTLIQEAVADKDLWIWHAFFGMAGTHNDINVLDRSPLFDDIMNGKAPKCIYTINNHQYNMGYYLTDGIYPKYATLIQTISEPVGPKNCLFTKVQERYMKDIEHAFDVLQQRFAIVRGPAHFWKQKDLARIMKTCIILHNMIIEDERGGNFEEWRPLPCEDSEETVTEHDNDFLISKLIVGLTKVWDKSLHKRLKTDLIEHIWNKHGDGSLL